MAQQPIDTVLTITPNPAVDFMLTANGWQRGEVNKGQDSYIKAGGKGINVATALAELNTQENNGLRVLASGWLGQENESIFVQHLNKNNIEDVFVRVEGSTRTNVKVTDNSISTSDIDTGDAITDIRDSTHHSDTTDFNLTGLTVTASAHQTFADQVDTLVTPSTVCVLAGSLPTGIDADFYVKSIPLLRKNGHSVILDTSGTPLHHVIQSNVFPQVMKPNIHELRAVSNLPLVTETEIVAFTKPWFDNGLELLVVSLGKSGALFISATDMVKITPPDVAVTTTVGAGDAMVAGIAYGLTKKLPLVELARFATALSVAKITVVDKDVTLSAYVQQLLSQVVVVSV